MLRKRVNLFGVDVDDISLCHATFLAYKSIKGGKRRSFFTPNLEMLSYASRDEKIQRLLNSSTVSLPDGYSLKMIGKILGKEIKNTVAGIEFGEALLEIADKEGTRVFLLGGKRGVAEKAAENILFKYPNLKICGMLHGYFNQNQAIKVSQMIEKSGAEILIVCQGFPKQERFANYMMENSECIKVVACLGGALDVWSGALRRAPRCMREMHLEWLWRIIQEPGRSRRFVKSLNVFPIALETRIEKILFCGMKELKRAYNQTDKL